MDGWMDGWTMKNRKDKTEETAATYDELIERIIG